VTQPPARVRAMLGRGRRALLSTDTIGLRALLADDPTFEEDVEPLATQQRRDVIDSLYYLLRVRLAG